MTACKCCGQQIPETTPLGIHLSPMQEKIVAIVRAAGPYGIQSDHLIDKLYADDPNGGPDTVTMQRAKATVYWTNRRLALIGKEIRSTAGGGKWGYRGRYIFQDKTTKKHGRAIR